MNGEDEWGEQPLPIGDIANNYNANPMVVLHGKGPAGATCRYCRHVTYRSNGNRQYVKCSRRGITRGQGTDHRLKWDACRLFEAGL